MCGSVTGLSQPALQHISVHIELSFAQIPKRPRLHIKNEPLEVCPNPICCIPPLSSGHVTCCQREGPMCPCVPGGRVGMQIPTRGTPIWTTSQPHSTVQPRSAMPTPNPAPADHYAEELGQTCTPGWQCDVPGNAHCIPLEIHPDNSMAMAWEGKVNRLFSQVKEGRDMPREILQRGAPQAGQHVDMPPPLSRGVRGKTE